MTTPAAPVDPPSLAVLDLDNVVSPWWSMEDEVLVEVAEALLAALPAGARTIGACTHRVGRRLAALDLGTRLDQFTRVRARPEAADRLLLGALRDWSAEPVGVAPAAGEVWLATGDRRFAGPCGRLRRAGHAIVVVAPMAGLSPQLRRKADRLIDLRRAGAVDVTDD